MIRELIATLIDWLQYGDLSGHLRAWLQVAVGDITPDSRIYAVAR